MTQQQPPADPALLALIAAYQAQTLDLRNRLERFVRGTWRGLGLYRNKQQVSFARDVVPVVSGAQRQMVSLTTAHLAHLKQFELGGRFKPTPVNPKEVTGEAARNGAAPPEVYGRPFHLVWRQLDELPHEPGSIVQAISAGEKRAVQTALTDVQLTKVQTAFEVGSRDDQVRWQERVLEGPHSCGLCIVASTQTYHNPSGLHPKLLPIHPGCDCSVRYAYGKTYPGRVLDLDRLQDIHDRIEERFGQSSPGARHIPGTASNYNKALQYRDVLVTHEHGELGPILSVRGAEFTGVDDLI